MRKSPAALMALLLLVGASVIGGCASSGIQSCPVEPLSNPEIRFDDSAHRYVLGDHVYFSKEASGGGQSVGGGGCGCN